MKTGKITIFQRMFMFLNMTQFPNLDRLFDRFSWFDYTLDGWRILTPVKDPSARDLTRPEDNGCGLRGYQKAIDKIVPDMKKLSHTSTIIKKRNATDKMCPQNR